MTLEGVYKLGKNRFVGVDRGSDEFHTEVEFEVHKDGSMTVHDIRQTFESVTWREVGEGVKIWTK